jgi:hypothetical protein
MHRTTHIRNGIGAVGPYVFGPRGLVPFLEATFSAEEIERSPDGHEVELRVGD